MDRLIHTPEGVRDIYGNEFVQKFELQQLLYRMRNTVMIQRPHGQSMREVLLQ